VPPARARLAAALPVLRLPQFRLLLSAHGVSVVGDALFPVALAFAVLDELDGTPSQLAAVLAAQALPLAALVLAAGVWADRLPRQRIMLVSDVGRAAVQAAVAALLLTGTAELWHLIALVALYGTFEAGFLPASGGLVPQVTGPEHLQEARALMGLVGNTAMIAGPALAGVLIVVYGPGAAIALDAATFLVSATFLARLRPPPLPDRTPAEHAAQTFWADLKGGVAEVRKRRWMWTFMPTLTTYHLLALPCVFALGPVIAHRDLGGAAAWATISACFGIGTLIGGLVSLRIRPARPMLACALAFLGCACQPIIVAYGGSTAVIAALQLAAGVSVSFGWTLWDTTLGQEIPPRAISRVSSLDFFTTTGALPVGYALVAWMAATVGTRNTMLASGLLVMALCAAAIAIGDVRRLRARTAAAA
jgi:MFS family permease